MPQIVWTVLPNGVDGQLLKVSIFVSLRLDDGPSLQQSFSQNWTQLVANLSSLQLVFNDGGADQTVTMTLDKSLLTPHLWTSVFPPAATPVRARKPAPETLLRRPPVSYSIRNLRTEVETLYKTAAQEFGTAPPPSGSEGGTNFTIEQFAFKHARTIADREQTAKPMDVRSDVLAIRQDPSVFYHAYRFYRRDLNVAHAMPNPTPAPTVPQPDFHQAIGMLGDHPELMRRLGLVIDGTVPRSAVTNASSAQVRLSAPAGSRFPIPSTFVQSTPWTHYTRESGVFLPEPDATADSDLKLGMLKLGDPQRFEIQQLDVDGTALKVGNYAVMVFNDSPEESAELPNLRTAGIVVGRNDRLQRFTARLNASSALEGATGTDMTGTVLRADDLLRGYRLDVLRASDGKWRSLCQREGSLLVGASRERVPAKGDIHDEGYIKTSAAASHAEMATTDENNPLYVHEALFEWSGWSPVIPPPGRSLVFNNNHAPGASAETTQAVDNTPAPGATIQIEPHFKVEPGTLPKLRFGETYRIRVRAVDLAGNSLPLSTNVTDTSLMSAPLLYQRYEPIPTPALVLRRPVVEGESLEHIVIRSKSGNGKLSGQLFFSTNDRHLAPPSTSLDTAILHGELDAFFTDTNRTFNIGLKADGSFLDRKIYDVRTGRLVDVPGIEIVSSAEVPPGSPTFPAPGAPLLPGQYVIHQDDQLLLPYLPDPLAAGAALTDVPTTSKPNESPNPSIGLHKAFFEDKWPLPEAFKIVVKATDQPQPSVDIEGDDLVVHLPPATILPLRLSSLIEEDKLQSMAIWNLIDTSMQATLRKEVLDGQHWMITPWRQLITVHAVERPLAAATFQDLRVEPQRLTGETFAILAGQIQNHSHSTGQLDIQATWNDRVDRLTDPGPKDEAHSGRLVSYRPPYDDSLFDIPAVAFEPDTRPKHDFADTKHRYVNYRADSTTRYLEYFPPSVAADPTNVTLLGKSTQVNVFSSARPDKPQILYIVPTFRWEAADNGKTSRRVGRGLRIYLARPWFSSGVDELLAVLLPADPNVDAANDPAEGFISEWGSDPIWDETGPSVNLQASHFASPRATPPDPLSILEKPKAPVRAVAFDVDFSAERQVWFVDIEMTEAASYFPFVRFAFARYQPFSIKDAELSPVVRADFVQLVNDRSATLQVLKDTVHVSVTGAAARNNLGVDIASALPPPMAPTPVPPPGFKFDPAASAGRLLVIHFERRREREGDLDWKQVGDSQVLPSFSPTAPVATPEIIWAGDIPRPARSRDFDFRLVVREIEVFDTDGDTGETLPVTVPAGHAAVRGRVAYLDAIELEELEY